MGAAFEYFGIAWVLLGLGVFYWAVLYAVRNKAAIPLYFLLQARL